jgi:hypothetical protein
MQVINNGNVYIESYDSLGDAVRRANEVGKPHGSSHTPPSDWNGGVSYDEATKLAMDGWHAVRPDVDRLFHNLEDQIMKNMDEQFATVYGYSGDMVDMGRYVAGDPECMVDYVTEPSARMGRVVKVLVNMSASSSVKADTLLKRGVAVTALVDVLHKLGVGIELWVEMPTARDGVNVGDKYSQLVKMHDSSEPLDIDNLMYGMCHPSMLRRIGFALQEGSAWKHASYTLSRSYGYPANIQCAGIVGADVVVGLTQDAVADGWRNDPVAWVLGTVRGLDLLN